MLIFKILIGYLAFGAALSLVQSLIHAIKGRKYLRSDSALDPNDPLRPKGVGGQIANALYSAAFSAVAWPVTLGTGLLLITIAVTSGRRR